MTPFTKVCLKPLMRGCLAASLTLLVLGLVTGCQMNKKATVTGQHDYASPVTNPPPVIYVADFELPPGTIQNQEGLLSGRRGPVGRAGDRLYGKSSDPETRARRLVALMSKSLLKDLSKAGFQAVRQSPGAPLPTRGWLLRGSFSLVQEGNRLQRSIVGMGVGETDIKVLICVNDLSLGSPRPLWEVATDANSGKMVGGGATLAFGPYGAAVAFVRAGQDVEKNVKQTAAEIAAQVSQHIQNTSTAQKKWALGQPAHQVRDGLNSYISYISYISYMVTLLHSCRRRRHGLPM